MFNVSEFHLETGLKDGTLIVEETDILDLGP